MAAKIESTSPKYTLCRLRPDSKHLQVVLHQIRQVAPHRAEKLKEIAHQKERSCRLLFKNKSLVGFFIYKRNTRDCQKWERSMKLELLTWFSAALPEDCAALLEKVKLVASDREAKSIDVRLLNTENRLLDFFTSHGFREIQTCVKDKERIQNLLVLPLQSANTKDPTKKEISPKNEIHRQTDRALKRPREEISYEPAYRSEKRSRSDDAPRQPTHQPSYPPRTNQVSQSYRYQPAPKHHELTLRKKYIHQIRSGKKTVEGRINHGMVTRYRVGDTVRFFYKQNPGDDVRCEITDIRSFRTFREMLENSGFKKCVSDIWTLDEAEDLYLNIPGYAERAAASGVLAIHIKVISR